MSIQFAVVTLIVLFVLILVIGVKVLGCSGTGSISGVIKGVDWVTANAVKPAVANMSLGGGPSQALDDAVRRSAGSGVFYSLAAGNDGAEACTSSPARAGAGTNNGIVTTAATNSLDQEASWSNYGSCVDLWAPGVSILSTRKGGGLAVGVRGKVGAVDSHVRALPRVVLAQRGSHAVKATPRAGRRRSGAWSHSGNRRTRTARRVGRRTNDGRPQRRVFPHERHGYASTSGC